MRYASCANEVRVEQPERIFRLHNDLRWAADGQVSILPDCAVKRPHQRSYLVPHGLRCHTWGKGPSSSSRWHAHTWSFQLAGGVQSGLTKSWMRTWYCTLLRHARSTSLHRHALPNGIALCQLEEAKSQGSWNAFICNRTLPDVVRHCTYKGFICIISKKSKKKKIKSIWKTHKH